jgi:hypothetical protein
LKMKFRRFCLPLVAGSRQFAVNPDPDPDPHLSEK